MFEIAKRAFLNYTRNRKTMITFIIFPIILMSLLGLILNGVFSSNENIGKVDLYYYSSAPSKESSEIISIVKKTSNNANINFIQINSIDAGKNKVKLSGDSFVIFEGNNIDVYNNIQNNMDATLVNGYLSSVIRSTNAITESFKINAVKTEMMLKNPNQNASNVEITKLPQKKNISSYAYYSIAEISLFALYISIIPLTAIDYDERRGIRDRLRLAGISDLKYYLGNSIGYLGVSIILTLPAYLFAQFVLGVDWKNPVVSYLPILLLSILAVLIGQVVSAIFNNAQKSINMLKALVIPILAFLGGAYMPITNMGGAFGVLTKVSPLRWINLGLMNYLTLGEYKDLMISTGIDLVGILILVIILVVISKRRESRV